MLRSCWVAVLLLVAPVAGAAVDCSLREQAVVEGPSATVADVAQVQAPPELLAELLALPVQTLPDSAWRTVTSQRVRAVLAAARPGIGVVVRGEACRVRRAVQTITAAELAACAMADVRERLQIDPDASDISLLVQRPAPAVELPAAPTGGYRLLAEPLTRSDWGELPYRIRILEQGREQRRVLLVLRLERYRDVPVAARALSRGHIMGLQDVTTRRRLVRAQSQADAPDLASIEGAQLRADVAPGQELGWGLLRRPPLVRGGEAVSIRYESADFTLRIIGTALGDGSAGEWVTVRPQGGGRLLRGRVVAPGAVTVVR